MANTQIDITTNGTTTLATADKYCDRNIDVNVAVSEQATQFTNYYDLATITIDQKVSISSGVASFASDTECNLIMIPYHHIANEACVIRIRGIGTIRSRLDFGAFKEDGTTVVTNTALSASNPTKSYDEHGDFTLTLGGTYLSTEWYYIGFNFQYIGMSSASSVLSGPIITINEPIGNGGYVE